MGSAVNQERTVEKKNNKSEGIQVFWRRYKT